MRCKGSAICASSISSTILRTSLIFVLSPLRCASINPLLPADDPRIKFHRVDAPIHQQQARSQVEGVAKRGS